MSGVSARVVVLTCPDWSIVAALADEHTESTPQHPWRWRHMEKFRVAPPRHEQLEFFRANASVMRKSPVPASKWFRIRQSAISDCGNTSLFICLTLWPESV